MFKSEEVSMQRRLKILLAKAILKTDEDTDRHTAMIKSLESDGDTVTVRGASGTYPVVRSPTLEDLDQPTRLVDDPTHHPSTVALKRQQKEFEENRIDCLVVDMSFTSSQLGYMVGRASALGQLVLVLREKSPVMLLPRLDQLEDDPNVTIHEYVSIRELTIITQDFKTKVRQKLSEVEKSGIRSA